MKRWFVLWIMCYSLCHPIHTAYAQKISLNFQDIPVRTALQLLADIGEVDVLISDNVTGHLTLSLNEINWQTALTFILRTQGLIQETMDSIIIIAPKHQWASDLELTSHIIPIHHAEAKQLASLLQKNNALSDRGSIGVDQRTNRLWVHDIPPHIDRIQYLVNELDIPVRQVLIEAQIVIASTDFAEELGVRYHLHPITNPVETLQFQRNLPTSNTQTDTIALARLSDAILLDLEIAALQSEGRGEILAKPKLLTANRQTASIESGEEIPFQESTSSGATATTFKKAVLSLKVTPHITPDDQILLELQVNQDTVSPTLRVNETPGINTNAIHTNVLVNNQETIVLGGIFQQTESNSVERIPFLGSLPVLGTLFSYSNTTQTQEELLIFVTPHIQ